MSNKKSATNNIIESLEITKNQREKKYSNYINNNKSLNSKKTEVPNKFESKVNYRLKDRKK